MGYGLKVYNTLDKKIIDTDQGWAGGTSVEYIVGGISNGVLPLSQFNPAAREEILFVRARSSYFTNNNKTRLYLSLKRKVDQNHVFIQDNGTTLYDYAESASGINICIVRPNRNSYFTPSGYGLELRTENNRSLLFDSSLFQMRYSVDIVNNFAPRTFQGSPQPSQRIHSGQDLWICGNFLNYNVSGYGSAFGQDTVVGIMYTYNDPEFGTGAYFSAQTRRRGSVDPRDNTILLGSMDQYSNILVADIKG